VKKGDQFRHIPKLWRDEIEQKGTVMDEKKRKSLPKTILIVEDDEDIGNLISLVITGETSHLAMLVKDGFQALRWMKAKKPDLLILDYHLPGMTGIQLYDHLHARTDLADVPVVLVSSDAPVSEARKRHLPLIHKPFDLDEFLELVEEMIDKPVNIVDYQTDSMKRA
jgi:DNA-binding NtrC family response regulator